MARSARNLARLTGLFASLETLERAKVAELAGEMASLRDKQNEIFQSLAEPAALHAPFMALLSSRIGRIDRRLQQLEREHQAALKRFTEAAGRHRGAADLLAETRAEEARKLEQSELQSLLEFQDAAAQGRGKSQRSI